MPKYLTKMGLLTIFFVILLIPLVPTAIATGGVYINYIPTATDNYQHDIAILPNGKAVVAFVSSTSNILPIRVYNIDGALYGSLDYVLITNEFGIASSIYVVSDTLVYIAFTSGYNTLNNYFKSNILIFNPSSLTVSLVSASVSVGSSAYVSDVGHMSSILLYNGKYYFLWSGHRISSGDEGRYYLSEYTPGGTIGNTLLATTAMTDPMPMYWFQSPDSTQYAYAMWYTPTALLSYYTVDLNAKTATVIAACYASGFAITNELASHSKFIDGGLITNGTDRYLYFTWILADRTLPFSGLTRTGIYTFVSDRMWFNGTAIAAHFQTHMSYQEQFATYGSNICWVYGVAPNKSTVYFYYPFNSLPGPGTQPLIDRIKMTATNWFDSVNYGWTSSANYPTIDNIPIPEGTQLVPFQMPIDFDFTSQFALGQYSYTQTQVYSGLTTSIGVYHATVAYIPLDTPNLKTNTQYTFTITATINSLPVSGLSIRFLLNDREQSYKITNSQGKVTYLITFPSIGYYSFTWEVYDTQNNATILQYSLYDAHLVVASTGGGGVTPNSVIANYSNLFYAWIPVLGFVVVPMLGLALVGGKYAGGTGMVIGMLGGGFAGVVGGTQLTILPGYYLWLYLLFMGIALALAITIGRSGGNQS